MNHKAHNIIAWAELVLGNVDTSTERGQYIESALKNIIRIAQEMSEDISDLVSEIVMLRRENDGILPYLPDDFERYDDDDDL